MLCDFCCIFSYAFDDAYKNELCYIFWGVLEKDGLTIQGFLCWWCLLLRKRRYAGWPKASDFKADLQKDEHDPKQDESFKETSLRRRREDQDEFMNSHNAGLVARVSSRGCVAQLKLTANSIVSEEFDFGRDLIWTDEAAFAK